MPLPDRWEQYCPLGKVIPDTNFVAFKVPLRRELLDKVPDDDRFTPSTLMDSLEEQGKKLGLIIDLTFTTRYYNRQDFEKKKISYKKIFVQGAKSGQLVPTDSNFQEFVEAVKGHGKEDIVGVHCTHGVNRTGYFICRYMIEEMHFDPEVAVKSFGEARGHPIERETYLSDLLKRKKGVSTVTVRPVAEQTNGWKPANFKSEKKPRWRENRDHHPGWRQGSSQSLDGVSQHHRTRDNHPYHNASNGWPSSGFPPRSRGQHLNHSEYHQNYNDNSWCGGMSSNSYSRNSYHVENTNNNDNSYPDSRLTSRERDGSNSHRRKPVYHNQFDYVREGYRQREPYGRDQGSRGRGNYQNKPYNSDSARYRNAGWTTSSNSIDYRRDHRNY